MQSFPSRSDKRQGRFSFRAERGFFTSEETLYKSEAKKLSSNGFSVYPLTEAEIKRGLSFYMVSWEHPYGTSVPQEVEEYIKGKTEEYPCTNVKTLAQSLYIIAKKYSEKL